MEFDSSSNDFAVALGSDEEYFEIKDEMRDVGMFKVAANRVQV